ncbi:hypothetical protein N7507_006148 [Penicillium longicatenatum]|nr:hypothetical protein N7507_006148 [Penicillium longicatenatum]
MTTTGSTSTFIAADYTTSPDFQGWYLQTTPQPIICGTTETYYTSDYYAGCSNSATSLPMATGCDSETLLYNDDSYGVCPTSYSCGSYTIFPTEGAPVSDAVYFYECLMNWAANSIYRTLPARYESSTIASAVSETATTAAPTSTKNQHTATSTSTPTSTSTSTNNSNSTGLSGGAIGGIVVGCVAGVTIVLLLLFRRRIMICFGRSKPPTNDGPTWSPVYMPPQTQSMAQTEDSGWQQPSEMSSEQNAIHEIGSSRAEQRVIHELS